MTNPSQARNHDRDGFDYFCECGSERDTVVSPIAGILLIGGAEGGRSGEDAATR